MSIKISCPYCNSVMSIKTAKVGKFKPPCSKCKEVFVLEVTAMEPLQVKVGRIASSKQVDSSKHSEQTEMNRNASTEDTMESPAPSPVRVTTPRDIEQTIAEPSPTIPGDVNETMVSDKTIPFDKDKKKPYHNQVNCSLIFICSHYLLMEMRHDMLTKKIKKPASKTIQLPLYVRYAHDSGINYYYTQY